MSLRAHISNLQYRFARDLLLNIQVVVFHVWGFDVAVESKYVALVIAGALAAKQRNARLNGTAIHASRVNRPGSDGIVGWPGIEIRRGRQMPQNHVLGEGIVE